MKLKILIGAIIWTTLITGLHIQLNVGWGRLVALMQGRGEMLVGFLPVT